MAGLSHSRSEKTRRAVGVFQVTNPESASEPRPLEESAPQCANLEICLCQVKSCQFNPDSTYRPSQLQRPCCRLTEPVGTNKYTAESAGAEITASMKLMNATLELPHASDVQVKLADTYFLLGKSASRSPLGCMVRKTKPFWRRIVAKIRLELQKCQWRMEAKPTHRKCYDFGTLN